MLRSGPLALGCALLLHLFLGQGIVFAADSNAPIEEAPKTVLGPPQISGQLAGVRQEALRVGITESRRSAEAEVRYDVDAAPGPLTLEVPSTLVQLRFRTEPALPLSVNLVHPQEGGIFTHVVTLEVPASGRLLLVVSGTLTSGSDKVRLRRKASEVTHFFHNRSDDFLYHYTLLGIDEGVKVRVTSKSKTRTRHRYDRDQRAHKVEASMQRPFPIGFTLGVGGALSGVSGNADNGSLLLQGAARLALDGLLPYGDVITLQLDGYTRFVDNHQVALGLCYQLYSPLLPLVPVGGHLDLGAALDVWPVLAPGIRLGGGLHVWGIGVLASVDLFPEKVAPPLGEAPTGDRYRLRHRSSLYLALSF